MDGLDHVVPADGGPEDSPRLALFTDTLGDVNGVTRFIRTMGEFAHRAGKRFDIATSTNIPCPAAPYIHNFRPLFATTMPGYSHLEIVLPPALEMLRWARRTRPQVIHVSTPGPVGVVGVIAAKVLKAPLVGTYHTDFPAFIDDLFGDGVLTRICQGSMRGFYRRFARVLTRSREYIPKVMALDIPRERITALTPGCDVRTFDRGHVDRAIWDRLGVPEGVKVLSCGRVSVEKNLPLLCEVWKLAAPRLAAAGVKAHLVVVGDGPYRPQMERELAGLGVHFLGYRFGKELSTLYASADLCVFPSVTDTLGQVVMEAQASGLPAIVSDQGGPKEIVRNGVSGVVLAAKNPSRWADAIVDLARDPARRAAMSEAGYQAMRPLSFDHSFRHFWAIHEDVLRESRAALEDAQRERSRAIGA